MPYLEFKNSELNIKELDDKGLKEDSEEILKKISKNMPKTIVVLDNVERLENFSWEVLKAIFKISVIENLVFILPMNLNKLENNLYNSIPKSEYPIEKYLDMGYFDFKQDYLGLLDKLNFSNHNEDFNLILNDEIEGQKLSIREVEQRIKDNEFSEDDNDIKRIINFVENIWGSKEKAIEIFSNYALDFRNLLLDLYEPTIEPFLSHLDDLNDLILDGDSLKEKISNILDLNQEKIELFLFFEEENRLSKFIENFKSRVVELNNELKNLENDLKNAKSEIKDKNEKISNLMKKIEDNERWISSEKEKEEFDSEKVIDKERVINLDREQIDGLKAKIKKLETEVAEMNNTKNELEYVCDIEEFLDSINIQNIQQQFEFLKEENSINKIIFEKTKELEEINNINLVDANYEESIAKLLLDLPVPIVGE